MYGNTQSTPFFFPASARCPPRMRIVACVQPPLPSKKIGKELLSDFFLGEGRLYTGYENRGKSKELKQTFFKPILSRLSASGSQKNVLPAGGNRRGGEGEGGFVIRMTMVLLVPST